MRIFLILFLAGVVAVSTSGCLFTATKQAKISNDYSIKQVGIFGKATLLVQPPIEIEIGIGYLDKDMDTKYHREAFPPSQSK